MKYLTFVILFVALCYCQTTINIYNNGGNGGCSSSNNPHHGNNYHFITPYNVTYGYYDGQTLAKVVWDEVLRRNPSFNKYVTPLNNYPTKNFFDLINNCLQDVVIGDYGMRPISRSQYKFVKIYDSLFTDTWFTGFTNLPKLGDTSSQHACPVFSPQCAQLGFCGVADYNAIVQISKQNNATIYFYDLSSNPTYSDDTPLVIQKLRDAGADNLVVVPFEYTPDSYLQLLTNISTIPYTQQIHLTFNIERDDPICQEFNTSNLSLYEFRYPTWNSGFPVCPSNLQLIHDLEKTLTAMRQDLFICKNLQLVGYCKNHPLDGSMTINPELQSCIDAGYIPDCVVKKSDQYTKKGMMNINLN